MKDNLIEFLYCLYKGNINSRFTSYNTESYLEEAKNVYYFV